MTKPPGVYCDGKPMAQVTADMSRVEDRLDEICQVLNHGDRIDIKVIEVPEKRIEVTPPSVSNFVTMDTERVVGAIHELTRAVRTLDARPEVNITATPGVTHVLATIPGFPWIVAAMVLGSVLSAVVEKLL